MIQEFVIRMPGEGRKSGPSLLKAEASETRGAYIVRVNESVPPGAWIEPHIHHAEEEAWYVLSGELTFRIAGQSVLAPSSSFVLVPRGIVHSFGNDGNEPARFLQIFSPSGMEQYFFERQELAATLGVDYAGLDPEVLKELGRKHNLEVV